MPAIGRVADVRGTSLAATRERAEARTNTTEGPMIRKLKSGQYRLYSRKTDAATGKRRNLGTFATLEAAKRTLRPTTASTSQPASKLVHPFAIAWGHLPTIMRLPATPSTSRSPSGLSG